MITINLEKELIKENRRLITPSELLLIEEYDKKADLIYDCTLEKLGLNERM